MNNEERTLTLIELCANYARELSSKDAEIQRLMQVITRKHSVTPVLSSEQIKEEAEKYASARYTKPLFPTEWQIAFNAYIAALTAHPKQHTE